MHGMAVATMMLVMTSLELCPALEEEARAVCSSSICGCYSHIKVMATPPPPSPSTHAALHQMNAEHPSREYCRRERATRCNPREPLLLWETNQVHSLRPVSPREMTHPHACHYPSPFNRSQRTIAVAGGLGWKEKGSQKEQKREGKGEEESTQKVRPECY